MTEPRVFETIQSTRGNVLSFSETICDARFSKCCGGMVEDYAAAWDNTKLDYLTVLYDDNRSQVRCLQITNPADKLRAFGLDTVEVDGHDLAALTTALARRSDRPMAVVGRTTKGQGSATLARDFFAWHRRSPNDAELVTLLGELDARSV